MAGAIETNNNAARMAVFMQPPNDLNCMAKALIAAMRGRLRAGNGFVLDFVCGGSAGLRRQCGVSGFAGVCEGTGGGRGVEAGAGGSGPGAGAYGSRAAYSTRWDLR